MATKKVAWYPPLTDLYLKEAGGTTYNDDWSNVVSDPLNSFFDDQDEDGDWYPCDEIDSTDPLPTATFVMGDYEIITTAVEFVGGRPVKRPKY